MSFEKALSLLRQGRKVIRKGWQGSEQYIKLIQDTKLEEYKMNPYFVIMVDGEGYTVFQPTVCDILAEDWIEVE